LKNLSFSASFLRVLRVSALRTPLLASATLARAHENEPLAPHDLWTAWSFDPGTTIPLALSAILYLRGARASRGITPRQQAFFWTGWTVLALSLVSPLHPLGEVLFSAHMVQHEILMLIAAPLLVLSRPLVAFLWALPFDWRRDLGAWSKSPPVQRTWTALTAPMTAWWVHAIALWAWHAPALFQATIGNDLVHAAQHASFLLSALLFWWALFYANGEKSYGTGVFYIFTTAVHTGILGALLTFARTLWYPAYSETAPLWGMTPIEDQQLGGLIMWVPAGLVYLAAGLGLFALWLRHSDRRGAATLGCILTVAAISTSCTSGQARMAASVTGGDTARGKAAITRYGCGSCHTIAGIPNARGLVGPPLTGIAARMYVAGVLPNNPENIVRWIRNPKAVDEKTVMPTLDVSEQDATDIAAYLYSIK
jgi:putative membrane protein